MKCVICEKEFSRLKAIDKITLVLGLLSPVFGWVVLFSELSEMETCSSDCYKVKKIINTRDWEREKLIKEKKEAERIKKLLFETKYEGGLDE